MKYKKSKYKEDLREGESFYDIYYQYNSGKFKITLSAKDTKHARERFILETNGDWCKIDYVKKKL